MLRALWTGATGMASQQLLIDTIANNLANVNTTGFKRQRVQFQDLYYENIPVGIASTAEVGSGSRVVSTDRSFRQGNLEPTDNPLSVAIEGPGFFTVETLTGTAYTRDGSFRVDGQGRLVNASGYLVTSDGSPIVIPANATDLGISEDGIVFGRVNGRIEEFGRLQIAVFPNPQGLEASGANLFRVTPMSGEPELLTPGENGAGILLSGYIETSNVEIVTEMVNLIVAQRAFELNSKTIETADQMWGIANNVKP
ncbi:MAG TPA: flagellar basal-body rod protein FlgG [Firmicutes bacterium]|nr:flagellar basal-body rod protein FlgG [Candidatus Fermentithermobacillaceae bacterium]